MTVDKAAAIIRQIEHYLGDFNLCYDKFFKSEMSKNEGWIPVTTFVKCNRVSALTQDPNEIVESLRTGDTRPEEERLLEVNEAGDSIRRKPSHPPSNLTMHELLNKHSERHVYCKGFPKKATVKEVQEFLEKVGPTLYINMRCYTVGEKSRVFKGSVNAVYTTKEGAEKFLTSEELEKYNGQTMIRMRGVEFEAEKEAERAKSKEQKVARQAKAEKEREAQVKSRMSEGALLELTAEVTEGAEKVRLFGDLSSVEIKEEPAEGEKVENNEDATESDMAEAAANTRKRPAPEAATNGGDKDDKERQRSKQWVGKVKDFFTEKTDSKFLPAWVDLDLEADKALVRFKDVNGAKNAWEAVQKKGELHLVAGGPQIHGRVLTGSEEIDEWKKIVQDRLFQNKNKNFRGPPNKRGRRR